MSKIVLPLWQDAKNPHYTYAPDEPTCSLELESPDDFWYADVRSDGCVNLHRYHNHTRTEQEAREENPGHMDLSDYLHICDVDDLIARLQEIKTRATLEWGRWP